MNKYIIVLSLFLFTACSTIKEELPKDENPYMKRLISQAEKRGNIASLKNIKVDSITQIKKTNDNTYIKKQSTQYTNETLKNSFLKEEINPKKIKHFDKNSTLNSGCYSRKILDSINTKHKLYKDYPLWYYDSSFQGKIGGVGIAKFNKNRSFYFQKKLATTLAKNDLSKSLKSNIEVSTSLKKELVNKKLKKEFSTISKQKSSSYIRSVALEDIYLHPKTCDLFVWIVNK